MVALVIVLAAGGVPLVWLLIVALRDAGTTVTVLLSWRTVKLLLNTAWLGFLVAVFAGGLGTLLAIVLTKCDVPGRRALRALLTFPLFLPPYVLALGWFTVLGRQGLVAAVLGPAAGIVTSDGFFGLGGSVLVLTIAYMPIVLQLTRVALRSIDPAIEEAARLRYGWSRIVRAIDLPLVAPAIALGMLLTFIVVVGEFGVPAYLRYPVFSGAVFTQFAAFLNIHAAVVTSVPLALLVLASIAVERYWLRERVRFLGRVRITPAVASLGAWRVTVGAGAWAYALLTVVLPVTGLILQAGGGASYTAAFQGAGPSIVESVWTATMAATFILALGVLLAYLIERTTRARRDLLDTGLLLLFAAPGTVLGVALILLWNRPGLASVYASVGMILIGYVAHYAPIVVRAVGVGFQAISAGLEEAARIAGVPWISVMRRVLLPLLGPALVGAWALAFVFCLRDLDLVMTIHPPGVETLPIRLYTLMANSGSSVTAALALLMVMFTLACVLVARAGLAIVRRISAWS